ncbi:MULTISPECIES: hypothetical protein [unclassified Streptomyces]|uniref:hypothetical protein n=1 Tax=unclassified Streptomyces TaxID=2593676 RepID=UPI003453E80F
MVEGDALPLLSLIILGSVAMHCGSVRLGKGAVYADMELARLTEACLVSPQTFVVTAVRPSPGHEHSDPHGRP